MVATATISESNGSGPTVTDSVTNINFGSTDATSLTVASFPITAGTNSYVKYIRMHFVGTFSKIDNLKVWATPNSPATGATIVMATTATYAVPTNESLGGSSAIPSSEPATANVPIGGSVNGNLTSAGYSDYIQLQLQTTGSTPAGNVTQVTFTFQYDEQ